jgi:hypothetical protein
MDNNWYKIYIVIDEEKEYLHYRYSKGFYWGGEIFATLFLNNHIIFDDKLVSFLNKYNYKIEKCEQYYSYHSYMKYHGMTCKKE